ncbi:hypothetical protein ABB30_04030 [Stenotrophomonas ginsengisoli]|uniref:Phosphatidylinositol kinase n=1 Tax=Stenotrophomonas ginsengisoli TaxID=336566 RepID=A0A0R0D7N4_9GAMM|nr:type II toxin-antitoxin system HipA family toxin [Stenotrophomonas ginsengisoli]KRG78239.1 hypothetical protein ABB30_04030 [Stenotrophomonas ginsengisoli]
MKIIDVHYDGWGQSWQLGRVAIDGQMSSFEYSVEAIERGVELAPFRTQLSRVARTDGPDHMGRLPGLISDSMPDGWGRLLIERLYRQQGQSKPDALDILAFVGDQAIGALTFKPSAPKSGDTPITSLTELAEQSILIHEGEADEVLPVVANAGGYPHGARPKALITKMANQSITTDLKAEGEPWLVKFANPSDGPDAPRLETLYAQWAGMAGINMMPCQCIELENDTAAFATLRFDREDGKRVPVFTAAGLIEANFRLPGSLSYLDLLRLTISLTRNESELAQMFARCVFNVVFSNMDDHPKNFSFTMNRDGSWNCAPAYDLTLSNGPGGEHSLDVLGKGSEISRADLLMLANSAALSGKCARAIIDQVANVASEVLGKAGTLGEMGIHRHRLRDWKRLVSASLNRMRG